MQCPIDLIIMYHPCTRFVYIVLEPYFAEVIFAEITFCCQIIVLLNMTNLSLSQQLEYGIFCNQTLVICRHLLFKKAFLDCLLEQEIN